MLKNSSKQQLELQYIYYFLRCRHKENAGFGDDAELSHTAENYKEKLGLLASGTSDNLPLACDHFQLQYATDLRTMAESLPTHAYEEGWWRRRMKKVKKDVLSEEI